MKMISLNKNKNIGKVLFIVEGLKTEFYLLHRIFTKIFDYQYEKLDRMDKYKKYNEKDEIESSIFVINTEESAIKFVDDSNEFLNNVFGVLIDKYHFPVDRAAIYYIFDRDNHSNTDNDNIVDIIKRLSNSRDSKDFDRPGLFLLSYPCIESFTASNFIENSFEQEFDTGKELKNFLNTKKINQSKISEESLINAVAEMYLGFSKIGASGVDLDDFSEINFKVFQFQEEYYVTMGKYKLLSLLSIVFLDLGIIEIEE